MISAAIILGIAIFLYYRRHGVAVFLLLSCLFWSLLFVNVLRLDPFISALSVAILSVMPFFMVDRQALSDSVLGYLDGIFRRS